MRQSVNNLPACGAIARRTLVHGLGVGAITASFTATAFGRPTMTDNTDAQIRHTYDRWQETIVRKDIDGLIALYAEDAIFETPAILVTLKDRTQGILRGKS